MKKILTLILIFCSFWVSAQLSNAKVNRIQNASTAFGFNIPVGDILYDANTKQFWGVVLARTSSETINDLTPGTHIKELTNETLKAVDDNSTNSTMYPLWTTAAGQVVPKVSTTKFTFNPSTGTVNASYFVALNFTLTSSDSTLKRQIKPLTPDDFEKASKIQFVKYLRKDDPTNRQHYGILAQEVEKQFPEMVYTSNGKKIVSYEEVLITVVAQQREEIELLKSKTKELEKLVNRLIEIHSK